eukprot:CAMPEP_0194511308 /NCGR_PEP_ID=MMETSP0253-20130528/42944_1 /TAXON_ID=2966 /ORGANISM="Noctiluca scintillans" /LENGTH=65 /DNA_ID=CAMNT_0039354633 /DNA_START=385 /DNA_END=582 /DNA_ORIENTATION=+
MAIDEETTAIDAHDVTTRGALSDGDMHHLAFAQVVLVHHEFCCLTLVCLKFAEQHRDRAQVISMN